MHEIRRRFHEELRALEGEIQQTGTQAQLLLERALQPWSITCSQPLARSRAVVCTGGGGWPIRPSVLQVGRSLGGLQRRLGLLGPGLGRSGASPLDRDHRGPVPLGVLHHLAGHLGHGALRRPRTGA